MHTSKRNLIIIFKKVFKHMIQDKTFFFDSSIVLGLLRLTWRKRLFTKYVIFLKKKNNKVMTLTQSWGSKVVHYLHFTVFLASFMFQIVIFIFFFKNKASLF